MPDRHQPDALERPPYLNDPAFWDSPENWSGEPFPHATDLRGHVFFRTSGSTGVPKWIALSKTALLTSAAAVNRHLEVTEDSIWGLALPIHHVGGFGVVARAFEAGCHLATFTPRWDPAAFAQWLEKSRVTHTSLVPTQVHDLVKAHLRAPSTLRAIVVGGGKMDTPIGQAARNLGWPVLASYGMTEAGSQIATQPLATLASPYTPAPIPVLPIWHTRLEADGRLAISGPALFTGTFTDGLFHPRPGDWHVTSDRVLLENRAISPIGRADHFVKVLGELIDPEEIVRKILHLAGGTLSPEHFTIVPLPDARVGNLLVPVFENRISLQEIEIFLARYHASAPGLLRLAKPVILDTFPRSPLGKPRRAELIDLVRDKFVD
ncbi:MAG: AMP-binding protein [Luteolibacter sp.]